MFSAQLLTEAVVRRLGHSAKNFAVNKAANNRFEPSVSSKPLVALK